MKRWIAIILVLLLAAAAGCGNASGQNGSGGGDTEAAAGAWEIYAPEEKAVLPDSVQNAFDKATESWKDGELIPAAYIADQVVAGMNYMILCRHVPENGKTGYVMAVVYWDLGGSAELTGTKPFDLAGYTAGTDAPAEEAPDGGWYVPEEASGETLPEDAAAAFEKAAASYKEASLEPLALLGTQVVAGMNYAILCKALPAEEGAEAQIRIITVYKDLKDKAKITDSRAVIFTEAFLNN